MALNLAGGRVVTEAQCVCYARWHARPWGGYSPTRTAARYIVRLAMRAAGGEVVVWLAVLICVTASASIHHSRVITPDNIFSSGHLFYRRLLLDAQSASLYVGANGHLFKLWAYNINDTTTDNLYAHTELSVSRTDADECRQGGHEECVNGVRLMFLKEGRQTLLVCSSNAMKPQLRELDALTLRERSSPENVIGVCSPDPNLNTTATLVEWGNPDDIPAIYSGIRTGLSLDNHLIYRPPLVLNNKEVHSSMRTVYTDSKWLNEPQFVASLSVGGYVYFFLREVAVERENCGRIVYSRVARLCKKDVGGKNVLRQVWTSFVKARLNCSISSQFPLYFDQIQSVQRVDVRMDTLFYATLTTADITFGGSAVCVFSLNAINQLLDQGMFTEQSAVGGSWTTTPPEKVPPHRPGTCVPNSAAIADGELHFSKSHLLMAEAVSAGPPLLTLAQELFTHIAVDVLPAVNVIFVYSHNTRKIFKLLHWEGAVGSESRLLASYELEGTQSAFAMALLPNEFLYLSDAKMVSQYLLSQCALYTTCAHCAVDPYCSWSSARSLCFKRNAAHSSAVGWVSAAPGETPKCITEVRRNLVRAYPGDAVHLSCETSSPLWTFNGHHVLASAHKYFTTLGGLVLLNVSGAESGVYECSFSGEPLVVHEVVVDESECAQPTSLAQFQSVYREWCRKLASYKDSANKWQIWYDRNVSTSKKHF
ncbi:Semaphorin-2A [Toxocara canis]|uniref:Semaphorin-2A n=1 Tax=Toxocara canis TaxID=6265 RepID=A0A0B2VBP8_TOXCA|nr:Semaphorin-2A [Toxocara canis]